MVIESREKQKKGNENGKPSVCRCIGKDCYVDNFRDNDQDNTDSADEFQPQF